MTRSPIVLLHTDKPESACHIVQKQHSDLTIHTCNTYSELPARLAETKAEVIYSVRFAGTPDFPRQQLLSADHVNWISVGGSGTDHLLPWDPSLVTVTNAAGVAADMMAEYVLGCVLSFRLKLRQFQRAQQQHQWSGGSVTPVAGQTALLIGLGQTNQAVAKRLQAMDVRVLGVRANPGPSDNVDQVYPTETLTTLLPQADIVVVAVPLLPTTRQLLSHREFQSMKANTILVDVSRGGVVDETALIQALQSGHLSGAALDVFSEEPLPSEHALWDMENVIITPHCSSVYEGWEDRSVEMFANNLHRYRQGQTLDRIVDPQRGY
jgi:phosphoglycerate dehydrogenase-like enzyme